MGKGQLGGAPSWFKKITDRIRRDISNSQGQNVITYPYYESSKTENGVQFSIRSDGTIKVNGTATADTYFILHNYLKGESDNLTVPFGIYALSGCPKGGSSSTYFMQVTMRIAGSEYDIITDYGDGGIGDIDNEGDYITSTDAYIGIKICVKSGTTVSDIIIKPMLEKGTASHEYQPTNISNRTLLSTKVDKVDGKQLSTEDFTTEEKEALGSLMGGSVTGVKGNAESSYRTGNVNLTPANIGALATNGDSKSNTVTFTSNDVDDASATSWTSVSKLATGITHATFFQRVSQMFKNVRYIYKMLGTTDISKIGNGTVTGALSSLNSNLDNKANSSALTNYYNKTDSDARYMPIKTTVTQIASFGNTTATDTTYSFDSATKGIKLLIFYDGTMYDGASIEVYRKTNSTEDVVVNASNSNEKHSAGFQIQWSNNKIVLKANNLGNQYYHCIVSKLT